MRNVAVLVLVAALGVAASATAQPTQQPQPKSDPSPAAQPAPKTNPDAEAALAMTIRHEKERAERIARIACDAGDKEKCAQLANADTTPKTPSP